MQQEDFSFSFSKAHYILPFSKSVPETSSFIYHQSINNIIYIKKDCSLLTPTRGKEASVNTGFQV